MRGYVVKRKDRFYAVIYEGIDPITGRERRSWHPAGTDRDRAIDLASQLAAEQGENLGRRVGPTFSAYLTRQWLPTKKLTLRPSTWDSYRRNTEHHVLPELGRILLRHVRAEHLERLYAKLLETGRMNGKGGLDAKTVLEVHMVLRLALSDALRRGLIVRNPAESRWRHINTSSRACKPSRLVPLQPSSICPPVPPGRTPGGTTDATNYPGRSNALIRDFGGGGRI